MFDEQPDNEWIRAQAEEDQAAASLAHMAQRLAGYRQQLILHNFNADEAFDLVADYHSLIVAHYLQASQDEGGT